MKYLLILLMVSLGTEGQQQATAKSDCNHNASSAAVNAVRFLNTAEYSYKQRDSKFGELDALKSSEEWKTTAEKFPMLNSSGLAPGYDISLITDAAGTKYSISARALDNRCASFFSDEKGLIFQGTPIH